MHFPHLTVKQTLDFAIASRTPETRISSQTRQDYQDFMLKYLTTVFGLRHTLDTKVGNDYVRGVSGGERKRVSIAEALSAQASLYCWDNATRGLDASTALEYAQTVRASANLLKNVGIVAIYQAGENIYELFDKVTVLYQGRQIYFGPVERAKAYFEEMGFLRLPRQSSSEFLTAVTDPKGRFAKPGMEGKVPQTADDFEKYWHNSSDFQKLLVEIEDYNTVQNAETTIARLTETSRLHKMKNQREKSRYTVSYLNQVKLTTIRGYQRIMGDKTYTFTNIFGTIAQALIVGSLFYNINTNTSGAFSRGGVLFFTLMFNSLSAMAEVPNYFLDRAIVLKQKGYSFYHPSAETLQYTLSNFPFKFITYICYGIIVYFLSQLEQNAGKFFFYLLILTFVAFTMAIFFQLLASWTKKPESALALSGVALIIIFVYSGYIVTPPDMRPWFKWLQYLNPLMYGFADLMSNEFHSKKMPCDLLVPSGPGYENVSFENQGCAFVGSELGHTEVSGAAYILQNFRFTWNHSWRNFGIIIAFLVGFLVLSTVGAEFVKQASGSGDVLLFKRGYMPENGDIDDQMSNEVIEKLQEGEPDVFSWQHVNYTVPIGKGETRQLLKDVQGYVKPGSLTALMGESGAGKTTLLNVLSQRINVGIISGDMFVNGASLNSSFKRSTGYVQQQDLHLAESTVREALRFSARLRQPASVPDSEKLEYVEKVINLLGMKNYAESFVGKPGEGLNVEQRKKLSIGVELAAKPSLLLFLDEPTSGLDSQSAWGVVQLMKHLAAAGQSILCTIHQPSATLFEQFDRLLLLKKGGQTVYFGDIGENSRTLIEYFEQQGAKKCSSQENPAEYILECIGAGATASVSEDWAEIWNKSENCKAVTAEVTKLHETLKSRPSRDISPEMTSKYAASHWNQFKYVLFRTTLQFWRSPSYIMSTGIMTIIGGLFTGFTYFQTSHSVSSIQAGLFGVFLLIIVTQPLANNIAVFAEQSRDLFEVRESSSNTFHWSHLLLSQFFSELPYHVFFGTIMYICFYFTVGFDTKAEYAGYFFLVYCVFFQFFHVSFSLTVLYFSPNAPAAAVISALLFSFMISFCGVTQPMDQMPRFWIFMYRVSPHTYFVQSLLGIILNDREIICDPSEFSHFYAPSGQTCQEYAGRFVQNFGGYLQSPEAEGLCGYCRYSVGSEYLSTIGIHIAEQKWRNIGIFCAYIIFNFVAMLGLYWACRVKVWKSSKN